MDNRIFDYLPSDARAYCKELLAAEDIEIKIVNIRKTRHGDYKRLANGKHLITLNATPNPYRFLITLIHEIAHLQAFEKYGKQIKPHGREWKYTFKRLMLPCLRPDIFPEELLPVLAEHFKNPKASSTTDTRLALALTAYDPPNGKTAVLEIPHGSVFKLYNGKLFKRGNQRVKRIECTELSTGRLYLFQPNAEVVLIKE